MSMQYVPVKTKLRSLLCTALVSSFSLLTVGCADVNVPDARNVNIPAPVTAEERRQAVNERPDSVMYLPLGEDVLVPTVLAGDALPSEHVGPFELRGETVAGALQLILADYDVSLAFETEEGLTRRITVANLKGSLDKVVDRVCSLADLYCSFEDGVVVVKDKQVFTVTLPPIGVDGNTDFISDVIAGLSAVIGGDLEAPVSDPTTRSIIYEVTQRSSKLAENYFQRLRANTALVVFETYIWEVSLDSDHTAGVNWQDFATIGKFNVSAALAGSAAGATNPVSIGLPTTNFIGEDTNPTEVFEFLSTFGAVKTISQPQISVLSGSSAELRVADTENYVSEITTTISDGQSTTAVSTDSVDSGFTLSIASSWDKSTVYADVDISLENVNSITPFTFSDGGPAGTSTQIQLPDTSERELSTQVRIRPGDSLLIGGLVRENDDFDSRGAGLMEPLIPDSRSAGTTNLELVFMMRPRVVVYTSGEDQRQKAYEDSKRKPPSIETSARTDWLKSNVERPYMTTREEPIESEALKSEMVYNPIVKQAPMEIKPPDPVVVDIPKPQPLPQPAPEPIEEPVVEAPVVIKSEPIVSPRLEEAVSSVPLFEAVPEPIVEPEIVAPVVDVPKEPEYVVVPEPVVDPDVYAPPPSSYEPPSFEELKRPVEQPVKEVVAPVEPVVIAAPKNPDAQSPMTDIDKVAADLYEKMLKGGVSDSGQQVQPIVEPANNSVVEAVKEPLKEAVVEYEAPVVEIESEKPAAKSQGRVSKSYDSGAEIYTPSSSGGRFSKGINQYGSEYMPE